MAGVLCIVSGWEEVEEEDEEGNGRVGDCRGKGEKRRRGRI